MRRLWGNAAARERWHALRWHSHALNQRTQTLVHLPPGYPAAQAHPVLYLLHGSGHTPQSVQRDVLADGQVDALGNAVLVIPDGQQGWWLDSPVLPASRYQSCVLELMEQVRARYAISPRRDAIGICGFSMGGTGAMLLAAQHPAQIGSVSSLLGMLDIEALFPDYYRLRLLLGTNRRAWHDWNPLTYASALHEARIALYTTTDGPDRPMNSRFAAEMARLGIPHEYHVVPGAHDTASVRQNIAACLAFHRRIFDVAGEGI